MEPAREMLGRELAGLPINVGWIIKRTPDVDAVPEAHLFVLLLGPDIWAPVGLELWWARRTEKPLFAYRVEGMRTPAGQVFVQENALLPWHNFRNLPALRRLVIADIGRFLLENYERYGLGVLEIESLRAHLAGLEKTAPAGAPVEAHGAGGGGVILAPGKDEPPGARVVGED